MQSNYHNLPMINGMPQKHGRKYKTTNVRATKNSFSANRANAYPKEAKVKEWIRSYWMKNNELVIKDIFTLDEAIGENVINFLTWGKNDIHAQILILKEEKEDANKNPFHCCPDASISSLLLV